MNLNRILTRFLATALTVFLLPHAWSQTPDSLNLPADEFVQALALTPSGGLVIGGFFTTVDSQPRRFLARVNADGTLGTRFAEEPNDTVFCLAQALDGSFLFGGRFATVGSHPIKHLGRMKADGTLDTAFNSIPNNNVWVVAVQPDGKILVGGPFTQVSGQSRPYLVRLNADGSIDSSFAPGVDGSVTCLTLQPDGKILIGGLFAAVGGQPRASIARLNSDGTLDSGFNPGADNAPFAMAVQPNGQIVVGGDFSTIGGQPRSNIARLNVDGSIDPAYDPQANQLVLALATQADGKVILGGLFEEVSGQARTNIARLNADGSLDLNFVAHTDDEVYGLLLQPDGKLMVSGNFNTIAGVSRQKLARLQNTEPAVQTLTYQGTTINWMRSGTAPEFTTVTFDHSGDGQTWTFIGNGNRITGGWEFLNALLPNNVTLRARGFAGGGDSSSFVQQTIQIGGGSQPTFGAFPGDVTLECAADTSPTSTGTPQALSTCTGVTLTFADRETPGNCVNLILKTITRTWTVTDSCGSLSRDQVITVRDTANPVFVSFPPDLVAECGNTLPAVTGQPGGTDACGSTTVTYTDSEAPGNCVDQQVKVITRTWRVSDPCGNFVAQNQTITVRDTTNPSFINFPANPILECGSSTAPAETGQPGGTDACGSASVTFADTETPGNCVNQAVRVITRAWRVADACGNFIVQNQTITVRDTTPPSFTTFPADASVACGASTDPATTGTATAADGCGSASVSFTDSETSGNCSGQVLRTITRLWRAVDACGNAATRNQTITVRDTVNPTFANFPANLTVDCTASTAPAATGQPGGLDNCGTANVTFTDTEVSGNCVNQVSKIITRAWRVTDTCGNSLTQNQTITVRDTTNPAFTSFPNNVTVGCNDSTTPSSTGTAQANDSCGTATVTFSDSENGDCLSAQGRVITRTWRAADSCGNAVTQIQTITVREAQPFRIITEDGFFGFRTNVFGFNVSGHPGTAVALQASTNGITWVDLSTNTLQNEPTYFSDPRYTNYPSRIYRAKRL